MLQWMRGSRQKVKASSASKQKRKKQYFEQRKRQQHQHISSYGDNLVGGYNVCNQSQKEKRSLDLLSLLSLSQVAEGCTSACADGARVLKIDPLPEKCPKTSNLPTFINKIATPANNVEASKISNPEQRMPEEELIIAASNLCNSTSKEKNQKREELNHTCGDKFEDLSIFELIDEDGKRGNKSEEKNKYEAHVAFSMQGLGEVGTETPANSPPQPSQRISSDSQSGLFETARHQYSCKNFDNLLEDHEMNMESMMGNGDMFSNDKYLSSDCRQSWRFDSYRSPKHPFLKDNSTEFYDKYPQVKSFDDKENFNDIQQMHADFLEVRSHFPVSSSCNEKFNMSEANDCFTDVFNINKTHEADLTEEFSVAKRKSYSDHQYGQTSRFCDLDFSSRYPKHQLAEDYSLLNSDDSNYFIANKFTHAEAKQSRCSYLKADNLMDNFSCLSGESGSSSAVKGDDIITPTARKSHKRRSVFIGVPSKPQSITEDFYRHPTTSMKFIPGHQREYERPRAYTRNSCDSYPLRPVHADFSNFALGETFGQVDDWSDKEGFPSTRIHFARRTDLGSSHHTSDRDHLSGDRKPVGKDMFDLPSASDFLFDSHLSFDGCKDESSVESATPTNLTSKKSIWS